MLIFSWFFFSKYRFYEPLTLVSWIPYEWSTSVAKPSLQNQTYLIVEDTSWLCRVNDRWSMSGFSMSVTACHHVRLITADISTWSGWLLHVFQGWVVEIKHNQGYHSHPDKRNKTNHSGGNEEGQAGYTRTTSIMRLSGPEVGFVIKCLEDINFCFIV